MEVGPGTGKPRSWLFCFETLGKPIEVLVLHNIYEASEYLCE